MRQFIAQGNFDDKGLLTVSGKDFRYMRKVLRLCVGDMLCVRCSDGKLVNSTICRIDEEAKKVIIQRCADTGFEPKENQVSLENTTEFWLFMFVPKSSKFDLIVRQSTECGIKKIIPVHSEYSQSGAEKMNFRGDRFERIIKEARQQSGSPVDTEICECVSVEKACELWNQDRTDDSAAFVLYERNDRTTTVHSGLKKFNEVKRCALVCGAEGGISPEEIELFIKNGFVPVHFDTNILRCETAALYGIAALQSAITEKKIWQCKE